MRRSIAILVLVTLASLTPVAHSARAAEADVILTERCSFRLLAERGIVLSTRLKLESVGDLPARVKLIPGWNVARFYPKAEQKRVLRLEAGETRSFVVTRKLPHAPAIRAALEPPARLRCVSVFEVTPLRS